MRVGLEPRTWLEPHPGPSTPRPRPKPRPRAPVIEPQLPTAAELYVSGLPGLPSNATTSLFAGNLPASPSSTDSDAHLYFLMAQPRHIPNRHRLIIWLNGGPGCSSFDGALVENGPLRVNKDGTLREFVPSWNEYATVVYLDQPAGTGFSWVTHSEVSELDTAADQVIEFLVNLYSVFPELATMDTYLAGESYAGQYIPYIATAMLETKRITTPLKGLLIGNGWISPKDQYPAYLDYLVQRKLIKKGSAKFTAVQKVTQACVDELTRIEQRDPAMKGSVLVAKCEEILGAITANTKNAYDTSTYEHCGVEWPPEIIDVTKYLRKPSVVKALHAPAKAQWSQCSQSVGARFWTPNSVPSVALLPTLLEQEIPILLFNGEKDLMCAGLGIERMIDRLEWSGGKGNGSNALDWTVDGRLAGKWTSARGLTYVNILNASHMVPRDQPLAAHDMLLRFMHVDTLHAAGPTARIPSRIGLESDTVLGITSPNGSTLIDVIPINPDDSNVLDPSLVPGGGGGGTRGEGSFDLKHHEALYGPRRTIVLVLLIGFGVGGIWFWLKWRRRRRKKERYTRVKGKGREEEAAEEGSEASIRLVERGGSGENGRARYGEEETIETREVFDIGEENEEEEVGADMGKGR